MRYMKSVVFTCVGACLLLLGSACSHLHVDTMSAWSPQDIDAVAYVVKDAPAPGAESLVREQISSLGWEIVPEPSQADAMLECEFGYKTDLNSESEKVRTLDSVHLRIRDADDMRTQAVSDYFYAQGRENAWEEGVLEVFKALNDDAVVHRVKRTAIAQDAAAVEPPATAETTEVAQVNEADVERETSIPTPEPEVKPEDEHELENIRTRADIPEAEKATEPESIREPERMEQSPWVPRFKGWGLDAWEGTE